MGHAVDQHLLSLVQNDVKEMIEKLKNFEREHSPFQESLASQEVGQTRHPAHGERFDVVMQQEQLQAELTVVTKDSLREENKQILEKLLSIEGFLRGELSLRLQTVEKNLAETGVKVNQIERENIKIKTEITGLCNRQGNSFP